MSIDRPDLEPSAVGHAVVVAMDPDGDQLSFHWDAHDAFTIEPSPDGHTALVHAPNQHGATTFVSVTATDPAGASATASIPVSTTQDHAPVLVSLSASPAVVTKGGAVQLAASAFDPDGDALSFDWDVPGGWTASGTGQQIVLTAPAQPGQTGLVTAHVRAAGLEASGTVLISTTPNGKPVVSSLTAAPATPAKGSVFAVSASASDPDGDPLSYSWSATPGWQVNGSGPTATATAVASASTPGVITLQVSDGTDTTSASIALSTAPNHGPTIASITTASPVLKKSGNATVLVSASDPDGDPLTYTWSVSPNWQVTPSGASATITAPNAYSASGTVSVTVSDGTASVSASLPLATAANQPPSITSAAPLAVPTAGRKGWFYQVYATDPDGDTLTYSLDASAPPTASIDPVTGLIEWHPSYFEANGPFSFAVVVSDGTTAVSQQLQGTVGGFQMTKILAVPIPVSRDHVVADVTGDGADDLITMVQNGDVVLSAATANGLATYVETTHPQGLVDNCFSVAAGDVDGDGDEDVITACEQHAPCTSCLKVKSQYLLSWINTGGGVFVPGPVSQFPGATGGTASGIAVADFNGDGHVDVVHTTESGRVFSWLGDGAGGFTGVSTHDYSINVPGGFALRGMALSDVTGDGHPDLVFTGDSLGSNNLALEELHVVPIDATGAFQFSADKVSTHVGVCATDVAIADVDHDGDPDVVTPDACGYQVHVFKNDGTGQFTITSSVQVSCPTYDHGAIAVTDLDGDGNVDFVAGQECYSSAISIFFGDGQGHLTPEQTLFTGPTTQETPKVFVGHWNADALSDVYFVTGSWAAGIFY